jgi:adenosylcobinamide-GDP ribazoletransferase
MSHGPGGDGPGGDGPGGDGRSGVGRSGDGPGGDEMSSLRDGVWLAVGTLTVVRVPPPSRTDREVARTAMLLAPAVGLIPAAFACVVAWLADAAGLASLVVAALAVATTALTTRGLHLDGLADTADGLASSYDRRQALAVMHRGDLGPAGGVTLVLVVLGQVACLAQVASAPDSGSVFAALVVAVVAGRATLPLMCARGVPSARATGLGATVIGAVPRSAAAVVLALTCGFAWKVGGATGTAAVLAAAVAAGILGWRCVSRLGGLTGDVLGAGVEIGTLCALLVLAAR